MAMGINTNVASLNVQRNVAGAGNQFASVVQRLSSGLRVNSAKDDAAGLAIATRLDAQSRGFAVASRNANDGISLLQISDAALGSVTDNLQRMRELAVQAKNGTNGTTDSANLKTEFDELASEVNKVVSGATFNGKTLLTGSATVTMQVGANTGDTRDLTLTNDFSTDADLTAEDISTAAGAGTAMTAIDTALDAVNTGRAELGANMSKFDRIVADLSVKSENIDTAKGRIMDADFAAETAKLTKVQILTQAGTAMLSQANQAPNNVMSLLR
jgi:flagellin